MLSAAILAAATVATSNAFFAYALGRLFPFEWNGLYLFADGLLLALGSATIAIFEAQAATLALRPRRGERRWLSLVILLLCASYSAGAMAHHVLKLQRLEESARVEKSGGRHQATQSLKDAERTRDGLLAEKKVLDARTNRALSEVQAELDNLSVDARLWRKSDGCTASWSRAEEACEPTRRLRIELAAAERRETVAMELGKAEIKVTAARDKLASSKGAAPPGPIEAFLSFWVAWALAVAIECCAIFGFPLAFRPVSPNPTQPSEAPAKRPQSDFDMLAIVTGVANGSFRVRGASVDPDGWVAFSLADLCSALDKSRPTVSEAIKALVMSGHLERDASSRRTRVRVAERIEA